MALQTQPNIALTGAWQEIASGVSQVIVQKVIGFGTAIVFIGATKPAADTVDGHRLVGETSTTLGGLTTEKVFARSTGGDSCTIAVTKG